MEPKKIGKLERYIRSKIKIVDPPQPYNHIGATLCDAVLQAGMSYETVVRPRVENIRKIPEAKTTSGLANLMKENPAGKQLNWKGKEKIERFEKLVQLFKDEDIENEEMLKNWIQKDENLQKLTKIKGIKNKTIDYLKGLCGIPTVAVDIHLQRFVKEAGFKVNTSEYLKIKELINQAADGLGINRSALDYSIWQYMSKRKRNSSKNKQ